LGFYFRDTRYLDTWELILNGQATTSLTVEPRTNARSYVFMMTNRDIESIDYGGRIPRDRLKILRVISLDGDQVYEQIEIVNYDNLPHTLELERRVASSFNDIFEVRGMRRPERGQLHHPRHSEDRRTLSLRYSGLDGKHYETIIWSPEPATDVRLEDNGAVIMHSFRLAPRSSFTLRYVIAFDRTPIKTYVGMAFGTLGIEEHMRLVSISESKPRLPLPIFEADDPFLSRALNFAAGDIASLLTDRGDVLYPDAGIPWFCAPFGRDGLITAYQMLPWCPGVAEGVLAFAFSRLGTKYDDFTDEEPGKVFHEERYGEMARTRQVPFIPYYGSVDATPLALILFGEFIAWTDKLAFARHWWEQARTALEWVRRKIAKDAFGFLTYKSAMPTGLKNQGWKDSHDSVMHEDGKLAEPAIALCEVQGYAYRALLTMARLAKDLGLANGDADIWAAEAEQLKQRFSQKFWDPARKMFVLALDGHGNPCRVMASNQGHCLWSWIADQGQAQSIAGHLLSDGMFSGYGIRTLGATEVAYNPLSYHNGSVWPHDNSLIAEGLRYYDCLEELGHLASAMLGVAELMPDYRLPELYCGFPRYGNTPPVPYDVACKPQAWAAGTLFLMLKALLGLGMSVGESPLVFRAPILPEQIKSLTVRRLPIRDYELDFVVRRGALTCTVELLRKSGGRGQIMVIK